MCTPEDDQHTFHQATSTSQSRTKKKNIINYAYRKALQRAQESAVLNECHRREKMLHLVKTIFNDNMILIYRHRFLLRLILGFFYSYPVAVPSLLLVMRTG